ncbi:MAG: hypothetical protein GTO45_15510 [Candidatus Aminicenantes bacterium]|nr:hypothetical protein [Candidatus Aminicenantes bacterium]NIM80177.1 hypothetical protein [Candidatus Aminicenantes bacterium]NIN19513.1 hypothetical protein [Candidatus Aminicenantes bacterium]NIN43412.1 hypothetical protein [Candidatus Aminicenantes bacterium]NIN86157.1 hypothetical protein [Candidatus Aminicenantes bacterium]
MKTKTFARRLVLNKTTVANLEDRQLDNVRGGTWTISCNEPCLTTSLHEPCGCNTSEAEPCIPCFTRFPGCNSSDAEPCKCV